jgi:MOSC domain-containing protein YiiM
MKQSKVLAIYIASDSASTPISMGSVRAIPGRGLVGDRYFYNRGFYSKKPGPDREVTLIEIESVERFNHDCQTNISPANFRRNVVTQEVLLNQLVGEEFMIGEVCFKGIRLCEPCRYLASILDNKKIMPGLRHQGGLRAQILSEGMIKVDDAVKVFEGEMVK